MLFGPTLCRRFGATGGGHRLRTEPFGRGKASGCRFGAGDGRYRRHAGGGQAAAGRPRRAIRTAAGRGAGPRGCRSRRRRCAVPGRDALRRRCLDTAELARCAGPARAGRRTRQRRCARAACHHRRAPGAGRGAYTPPGIGGSFAGASTWKPSCSRRRARRSRRARACGTARGFADAATCRHLVRRAQGKLKPAQMYNRRTQEKSYDAMRTNSDFMVDIVESGMVLLLLRIRMSLLVSLPVPHMEPAAGAALPAGAGTEGALRLHHRRSGGRAPQRPRRPPF